MYTVALITCIFWYTEECHVSVVQEVEIQYSLETVEVRTIEVGTIEVETIETDNLLIESTYTSVNDDFVSPGAMLASYSYYYDSYFGIDLLSLDFAPAPKNYQQHDDDIDVQTAQQYFKQMLADGQKPSTQTHKDDYDVQRAQMYFKQMLADGQQKMTTSSAPDSFLGKFDQFAGQACSLGSDEPMARFEVDVTISKFDPSGCAQTCLSVTGCTGFQIDHFRATAYCDLLSTCTKDRLQVVSGSELSTYLLADDNNAKDATSSFDYYYYYETTDFEFIIPTLSLFALLCFVFVVCRIKRRQQRMSRQAQVARALDTVRGTPVVSNKCEDSLDDDTIVIGHRVVAMPPAMKKALIDEDREQEF